MAKEVIQSFPAIPSLNMKNSPRAMGRLRAEMAEELLSASGKYIQILVGRALGGLTVQPPHNPTIPTFFERSDHAEHELEC